MGCIMSLAFHAYTIILFLAYLNFLFQFLVRIVFFLMLVQIELSCMLNIQNFIFYKVANGFGLTSDLTCLDLIQPTLKNLRARLGSKIEHDIAKNS